MLSRQSERQKKGSTEDAMNVIFSNQAAINSVVCCMSVCIHKLRAGQTRCWFVGLQELYLATWKICAASFTNRGRLCIRLGPFFARRIPGNRILLRSLCSRWEVLMEVPGEVLALWPHLSNVAGRGLKVSWELEQGGASCKDFLPIAENQPLQMFLRWISSPTVC